MSTDELRIWVIVSLVVLELAFLGISWLLFRLIQRVRKLESAGTRSSEPAVWPFRDYSSAAPASDLQSEITHSPAAAVSVISGGRRIAGGRGGAEGVKLLQPQQFWSLPGEGAFQCDDASLELGHAAEQADDGQSCLCDSPSECASRCLGLFDSVGHLLDNGFGDRQVVRDVVAERDEIHDSKAPYVARAVTRYVTGAFCVARRWLQRKAGDRQCAAPSPQPLDTTGEAGAVPPVPAPASPRSSECASRWASRVDGRRTYGCTRPAGHDGKHGYAGIRWADSEAVSA
ncbi:hypothetical protein [Mycolicibacterium mucogenicum]|uniref:Uncharacterized protein n=1 Tax=Mycolicibacterium mucogenicum DSM 44124 TaxID=1226753 RepID=A0A8E4R7U2_MYCMU|nr:hypothetical protein [Mycolicibacterium mucogenicum]QPG69122.1 hypothetical protein C1S78_027675 [Mycolicibacterium mucogenicum DSM 44124]